MGYFVSNIGTIIAAILIVCALGAAYALAYVKNSGSDGGKKEKGNGAHFCEGCSLAGYCRGDGEKRDDGPAKGV